MKVSPAAGAPADTAIDGFGLRTRGSDADGGDGVERLALAPALVDHPEFVAALAERVARFAAVRHASYSQILRLDRPSADRLELVSDITPGWRLAGLLAASNDARIAIDITIVIGVLRQLLPAVALYGRHNREAAIGTLGPERLILTPQARLVIAEHAFGPALEKLNLGRDRLWRELRVAMPPAAGLPRSNPRADANAIGVVALSLLLGRVLTIEEYPSQLQALVDSATESRDGERVPLSAALTGWLSRALQLDTRAAFQSPSEAQLAFESVLASDRAYVTSPAKMEEWVSTVGGLIEPPPQARVEEAAPAPILAPAPPYAPHAPYARYAPWILGVLVVFLLLIIGWQWTRDTGAPRAGEGELAVESRPPGARVTVDGRERGVTPLTVRLPAGAHVLEVQSGKSEPRVIPLMIRAGVQTAQYVELQEPVPAAPPPREKARKR